MNSHSYFNDVVHPYMVYYYVVDTNTNTKTTHGYNARASGY